MTFEEAKARSDYQFDINELEKEYFTCSLFFDAVGNHGAE